VFWRVGPCVEQVVVESVVECFVECVVECVLEFFCQPANTRVCRGRFSGFV